MTFTFKTLAAAGAILLLPLSAQAYTTTIDFGEDDPGSTFGTAAPITSYSEKGVSFDITFNAPDTLGPALFNTLCGDTNSACNGDLDLVPDTDNDGNIGGNVLILGENGSAQVDDDANGGLVTFTLTSGAPIELFGFSAIDNGMFQIFAGTDDSGTALGTISGLGESQSDSTTFAPVRFNTGDSFTFKWSESGGFDNLQVNIIPLPAPFALLLAAMGGFGFVSWRRARAAA